MCFADSLITNHFVLNIGLFCYVFLTYRHHRSDQGTQNTSMTHSQQTHAPVNGECVPFPKHVVLHGPWSHAKFGALARQDLNNGYTNHSDSPNHSLYRGGEVCVCVFVCKITWPPHWGEGVWLQKASVGETEWASIGRKEICGHTYCGLILYPRAPPLWSRASLKTSQTPISSTFKFTEGSQR